jgi:dCMP deaminase
MKKAIVAYVPVLHEGYRKFFERHADSGAVYIFGESIIRKFDYLAKEIRQLSPALVCKSIESWELVQCVEVLELDSAPDISADEIVMPDEDVCRAFAEEYFSDKKVTFDSVFLRWDKHKSMEERPVRADQTISKSEFDRTIIADLKNEAEKSSDWWRRIASAVVKDGKVILRAHNEHLPSPHSPYVNGDPRNTLHKGVGVEYSTSIHSEARLIADAARQGISLEGASVYVTVFPCPPCAKLIAFAGIKKLYYAGGYTVLDQEKILKAKGVEIVYVEEGKEIK